MKTITALFAAASIAALPVVAAAQTPAPAPAPNAPAPLSGGTIGGLTAGTVVGVTAAGFLIVVVATGDGDGGYRAEESGQEVGGSGLEVVESPGGEGYESPGRSSQGLADSEHRALFVALCNLGNQGR